ncbi:hypothetical protein CEXT_711251 [Caerostris extrusa]|uniref:Uncharacterized protein n=1 Tax=Caerostris extrusa TaxID=172846 RepID=A0AAV4PQN4_CAEEX|nr:hypothetical protein CEXT_711251 [Caerostris extrusa]
MLLRPNSLTASLNEVQLFHLGAISKKKAIQFIPPSRWSRRFVSVNGGGGGFLFLSCYLSLFYCFDTIFYVITLLFSCTLFHAAQRFHHLFGAEIVFS